MNARCFLLPAILIALYAAAWSPADELPKAPPPHVKKTTAELLVGKWKLTYLNGVSSRDTLTYEFTQDGKYASQASGPTIRTQKSRGTYTVREDILRLTPEANADEPSENGELVIVSLTEKELVARPSPRSKQHFVFKRDEGK